MYFCISLARTSCKTSIYRLEHVQFIGFAQKHNNRKYFATLKYTLAFPFLVAWSVLRLARSWRVQGSVPVGVRNPPPVQTSP